MKTQTLRLLLVLIIGVAGGLAIGLRYAGTTQQASVDATVEGRDNGEVLYYRNPMDPSVTSPVPAKDSMGMDYIPVYGESAAGDDGIRIDPRVVQNLGVRTAEVESVAFARAFNTVGTVVVDERGRSAFNPKVSGWIERLHVNAVGDAVEKGAVIAEIYSPVLLAAQEEYRVALAARERLGAARDPGVHHDAGALIAAARERLTLLDLSEADIAALERGAKPHRTVALRAPFAGIVMDLDVREGAAVEPGMRLFTLADLSRVWVNVDVYADQLAWVKQGDPVDMTIAQLPGSGWHGHVDYLYPTLDTDTRTVTARLVFDNPDGVLRPGMFANAAFEAEFREQVLAVPKEAVIRTGTHDAVMLALGDGRFKPVAVKLGAENNGYVEILSGLSAGQRIVLSGQFLLDAEAGFQGAGLRMEGGDAEQGGVHEH
jgi:Cu(I)/Ag(I) efflux system membrane fusion protein